MESILSMIRWSAVAALVAVASLNAQAMPDEALDAACPLKHMKVGVKMAEPHESPYSDLITGYYNGELETEWQEEFMNAGCMYFATEAPDYSMATVLYMVKAKDENGVDIVDPGFVNIFTHRKDSRSDRYNKNIPKICMTEAGLASLTFPQRVRSCYVSTSGVGAARQNQKLSTVLRGTIDSLKYQYANRLSVMDRLTAKDAELNATAEIAERTLKITDRGEPTKITLKALGYHMSLQTPDFWVKRGLGDVKSQKIIAAAKAMDERGLMFIDTNFFEKNQGPAVIKQEDFEPNQMIHLMGYNLEADLEYAMKAAGFTFSPAWVFEEPQVAPQD